MSAAGRIRRDLAGIGSALVVSSLLGFILLGVVARWLTPDDNAAFLSIWGVVFGFGSLISASEQEIARQATHAQLDRVPVPVGVTQYALVGLGASVVGVAVLAVSPWGGPVFRGSLAAVLLTFVAVGGFAVQFLARGVFMGTGQVGRFVSVLLLEALSRIVLAGALVLSPMAPTLPMAVAAIVVGSFGWLPVARPLWRSIGWGSGKAPWRTVGKRIGTLSLATGLSSLLLTAFPTLVTVVLGGSRGLATLFGVVTISRVPLVMVSPVQAMAVPLAVRALTSGRAHDLSRLQVRLGLGAAAVAMVTALLGYLLGPWAMRLFMGPAYDAPGLMVALLLSSSCFMAVALLQAAVFIALERYWLVVATWAVGVTLAVVCLLGLPGEPQERGMWSFVVASLGAYVFSTALLRVSVRRYAERQPAPADLG